MRVCAYVWALRTKRVVSYFMKICFSFLSNSQTNGAQEAIFLSTQALVSPGDKIVVIEPSFDTYAPDAMLAGGQPVYVPLTFTGVGCGWKLEIERLAEGVAMHVCLEKHLTCE